MKLAFLISAHTSPANLARLVNSLPEGSEFFIHIDAKSDIKQFTECLSAPNVHYISQRFNVAWGSFIEVEYQMALIREAISYCRFDYLVTLSGLDYPLWSNERITEFFANANGKNFIQGIRMTSSDPASQVYRDFRFFSNRHWQGGSVGSMFRVALRKAVSAAGIHKSLTIHTDSKEYKLYKGAAWWAITFDLALHTLKEFNINRRLTDYFRTSFCPAETFVQTVAFNSRFANSCMLAEGNYQSLAALTPLTYIYYNPTIKILTEEDYDTLKASDKMFCRKTIIGTSDALMDMIDADRK